MWVEKEIKSRLKEICDKDFYQFEVVTDYWEGYRDALKEVIETKEPYLFYWED